MNASSKYICQCKSVTHTEIKTAIKRKGARTLLDVQNLTRATTGCARCKPGVIQLLDKEMDKINSKGTQLRIDF